ncbi:MAG: hypothetical protein ACJART_000194 [Maribacter sp.]|jgi:hypothetical protein|tara:strand:+ start:630 stop:1577 length:948 start_codon:yes stop_codon:yes gene_type:complete
MKSPLTNYFCFFLFGISLCFSQDGKSEITINQPTQGTIWSIPDLVKLEWSVKNIDSEKSTRFFLIRDEMVVQELGSFKNSGIAEGIVLAKNIGSGNRYQVVSIELFPEDKFQIAKFISPLFTIVNKASDERKRKRELAQQTSTPTKEKKPRKRNKREKKTTQISTTIAASTKSLPTAIKKEKKDIAKTVQETPQPEQTLEEFEGRKILYTKDLVFNSTDISVKIWDHGRQDGDIVSIYLNGSSVVTKHYLTYYKREFKIKLNPNKSNDLFLYAHNLGTSPPNTVSVEISDGTKSENIILNSDLKSCEAVMISVKK